MNYGTLRKYKLLHKLASVIMATLVLLLLSKANLNAEGLITPTTTDSPTMTSSPTPTSEVVDLSKKEFSGEVTRINGKTLTVDTQEGPKEVTVVDNVKITKSGLDSTFEAIKVNDKVTIAQTDNGTLLSVAVTPAEIEDFTKMALPIGLGVLVLIGLLIYFLSKGKKGQIKTTTEKVSE